MKLGVDLFRHILALCVILQHMTSSRYSIQTNIELANLIDYIDGAVAGFFLISGYFSKRTATPFIFVRNQAIRLLTPFFLFSLIYSTMLFALGKSTLIDGILKTLSLHGAGMQLYFLPYLLLVSCLFAFLNYSILIRNKFAKLLLLSVPLAVITLILPSESSTGSNPALIPFYMLAFSIGMIIKENSTFLSSMMVVLTLLCIGFLDHRFFDLAGVSLSFLLAIQISKKLNQQRAPGSGGVYLLHTPIINFSISILLTKLGIYELSNIFLSVLITYIICLLITIAFIKLFSSKSWLLLE